jgi:hypothetical protein
LCNENYYISADYDHLTTVEYKKVSESDCIMGVELWIGEEFEHGHEMEALAAFLKNMVHSYTSEPTRFCVLANFMVNYSPIDLAVVKNNGLAIIELKQVGGPVFGGENGDWIIREGNKQKVLRGGSKGNPYNQVITYRISFLKFLDSHRSKFLQPRVGLEPRFDHVNGIVALAPTIPKGSEIDLPEVPWLKVVGLDELHREIFLTRSSRLALTSKEITRLLENVLRLRKDDIAKYMETTNRTVVPPVQVKPETLEKPIPAIEAPLTVVKPEKPHIEDVTSEAPDQAPCPVCSMGVPECALRSLSGRIEGITRSGESQYVFRIITDDFEPWAIPVHSCWNDYATRLKSWLDTNQSIPVRILHLEKEGDTLQVGQDSLLVIEPDWLINVTDITKVEFCQRQLLLDRFISSPSNEHMIRGNLVHQLFPDIWHSKRGEELEERRRELLQEQVEDFITTQSLPDDIKPKCDHAIEHLTQWVDQRHRSTILRTETFVLSPSLGTKGKIDFLWEDLEKGRIVGVGELKTGQSQGGNPKPGDALQLLSYTMMLFSRGEITFNDVYALLLYSGNTILGDRGSNLSHRLIPKFDSIKRAVNIRNDLVLMELTGQAQFESNMNKCRGCRQMSTHCARIALLSNEEDTRPVETTTWLHSDSRIPSEKESAFFLHYSRLIAGELRALKEMHAELWRKTPEQREAQGEAFRAASFRLESQQKGRYQYSLEGSNSSEFGSGDSVLISDCKGPSSGRVSLGIVQDTSKDALLISASEEIRFEPVWVDPYTNENLTIRLFKGLYRWISRPSQMSDHICSIPGTIWYKRALRPATKQVGDARLIINEAGIGGLARRLLDPNESAQFVNVPLDNTGGPRTNLKEAQIVCDIIEALATGGFSLGRKDAIAIICPRRAQVELIRRQLESLFRDKRVCEGDTERAMLDSVSTVDRFQGSQSDVVIVSLGMSDSSVSPHLADEKRLNVAMSRARHKLILLGNREALSQEDIFGNLFQTMSTELPYSDWYIEAG